ncbi:hypothetical protein ACKWTF_002713 [Chironomus riparius]
MRPLEKFEANCTVLLVTSEQQEKQNQQPDQQQQCDISLSAFSDIYNEYLSDHSEIETASTSDTDSSSSTTSISNQTSIIKNKENYEQKNRPDIRNNLHNNQLFGVQLEVNFLLLEAERRKLKILQQELNLSLDECDKFECKKRNQSQCHELLLTISRIQSQHNSLEKELAEHTIDILKYSNIRIIEKNNRNQPAIGLKQNSKTRPTIFGTVASDQSPKDISSRRGLPQTVSGHQVISSTDEFDSDENTLIYRDGNLSSATLEALIQHMVPTNDYYPDRSYIFAFLLSSRLFIKPYQLLSKIWDLSTQQQNLKSFIQQKLAQNNPKLSRFSQFLIQLLAEWVDTFPYDFRDERLMSQIKEITQTSIQINPSLRTEVSQLLQNLLSKLQELENYEEHLEKLNQQTSNGKDECDSTNKSPNNANGLQQQISVHSNHSHKSNSSSSSLIVSTLSHQSDISEICSSPLLLAHQLTHIELERLSHIGPEEFVQAFTKEHPSIETSFKDLKKTRNLESYVTWFNRLSYLVATDVIKHPKKKQRARIIEFWIETARESFNIGNFNSLMAIIAGLNMSPISRLKKTWAKIQSAKFSILEHQMDSSSNFSSYRSTLKAAMWRSAGATDERERIVIPFFSLLVKDLYFLNEGCSNKLPCGHINFEKFWQLAKQVTEFMAWKQVTCPFEKNDKLINYLQTTSILNECTLALASFECEPPENNHEKDHFKFLKNEVHK